MVYFYSLIFRILALENIANWTQANDDVRKGKTCDRGTSRRYLLRTENVWFFLFCFALESEKMVIMSGLQWYLKRFYFSPYYSCLFISIPNVNWFLDQFIPQFINVIATNNNLLMDELNASYLAPKLWLYVMIWLPRTTDNSTHFAQSLEIRGIDSRL